MWDICHKLKKNNSEFLGTPTIDKILWYGNPYKKKEIEFKKKKQEKNI